MKDGLTLTEMPDLPGTGLRKEIGALVKQNIRQLLVDAIADKVGHAYAVASGPFLWREVFTKHMGPMFGNDRAQCDILANICFQFLQTTWRDRNPGLSAAKFLDAVHVPIPETEAEFQKAVDDAWTVEIASDEKSMNQSYVGSARIRKGLEQFSTFWQRPPDPNATKH